MQIYAKIIRLQKIILAQFVALKQIYKMQFRAKLYLKQHSFSTISKSQPFYANLCKKLKIMKSFLAQFVALKQIYKMQFRAKLYLKQQSFSASFKFQPFYANLCKNTIAIKFFWLSFQPLNRSTRSSLELSLSQIAKFFCKV